MKTPAFPVLRRAANLGGMPMPFTYRHATDEFRDFLAKLRQETLIASDNVLYTGTEAVLHSFRARLTVQQAVDFANLLPAVLRAIFVQDWNTAKARQPWPDRQTLRAEMLALRRDHNVCPQGLLEALLTAIPATMRRLDLDRLLESIGPEATDFWRV